MKRMLRFTVVALSLVFSGSVLAADALSGSDKEFLKNAAELGVTEVDMGKLAEQHGMTPAVKEHGALMVKEHTKSNAELMALAKSKGIEIKAEPAGSEKQMLSALSKKSGAEFDKEYVEHQAKGHQKAIKMFQDAARDTKDAEIKAFASKQLPHLEHHLAALPEEKSNRTTGVRPQERHAAPGELERPKQGGRTEGAVRTEQ